MFGHRYFGRRWFGGRYFGDGDVASTCDYFFTSFEESSIGDAPPTSWTQRGTSSDHALTVASSSPPFKRRVATLSSADNAVVAFSIDAVDAFSERADVDVVLAVYRDASTPHETVTLHVRGQGTPALTDGYQFVIDFAGDELRIVKLVAGVDSTLATVASAHAPGEWMLYRFRANGGSTVSLNARTWATDETEPVAWSLSSTDSSSPITAVGWVGIGGYISAGSASSVFNFVSVATGGCLAYVPLMDDAFSAWLDRPSQRCVLAEFSAIGFESPSGTKVVNAYIANMGYTSHATDDPPLQHYDAWIKNIPTFRREMSTALSGRATTGFGSLAVRNPASVLHGPGARDDWLRMKWQRDYITLYIGDPSWAKSDFRKILAGTLGQPTAPNAGEVSFEISDLLAKLDRPLTRDRYASGTPRPGQLVPFLIGVVAGAEPTPISTSTLERQVSDVGYGDGINTAPGGNIADVYDDSAPLRALDTVSAVNAGTNTLSTAADHGMVLDYLVMWFGAGDFPAPLTVGVWYWVISAGLSATEFRLSATRGGSEIDISGTDTGALFTKKGWWEDAPNGKLTPAAQPVGRILTSQIITNDAAYNLAQCVAAVVFDRFGLSEDFKDADSFSALAADFTAPIGKIYFDEQVTALQVVHDLCAGTNSWYGFTPDGLLQVGRLDLPEPTAVMDFTESNIANLALTKRILPIDRATLAIRYDYFQLQNGPFNFTTVYDGPITPLAPVYRTAAGSAWPAGGVPLDDHPDSSDVVAFPLMESVFRDDGATEVSRLETLYGRTMGVFEFRAKLSAITLSIGQTISLTHPRLGWKQYDAGDPQSPDNSDDFDATKAVVIGIDVNLSSNDPFPVKLTVFRQIPGYYPEENLN